MADFEKIVRENDQKKQKIATKQNPELLRKYNEYNQLIVSSKEKLSKLRDELQSKIEITDSDLDNKIDGFASNTLDADTLDMSIDMAKESVMNALRMAPTEQQQQDVPPPVVVPAKQNILPEDLRMPEKIKESINKKLDIIRKINFKRLKEDVAKGKPDKDSREFLTEMIDQLEGWPKALASLIEKEMKDQSQFFHKANGEVIDCGSYTWKLNYIDTKILDSTPEEMENLTSAVNNGDIWTKAKIAVWLTSAGLLTYAIVWRLILKKPLTAVWAWLDALTAWLKRFAKWTPTVVPGSISGTPVIDNIKQLRNDLIAETRGRVMIANLDPAGNINPKVGKRIEQLRKLEAEVGAWKISDKELFRRLASIEREVYTGVPVLKNIPGVKKIPGVGSIRLGSPEHEAAKSLMIQRLANLEYGTGWIVDFTKDETKELIEEVRGLIKWNPEALKRFNLAMEQLGKLKTVQSQEFEWIIWRSLDTKMAIPAVPATPTTPAIPASPANKPEALLGRKAPVTITKPPKLLPKFDVATNSDFNKWAEDAMHRAEQNWVDTSKLEKFIRDVEKGKTRWDKTVIQSELARLSWAADFKAVRTEVAQASVKIGTEIFRFANATESARFNTLRTEAVKIKHQTDEVTLHKEKITQFKENVTSKIEEIKALQKRIDESSVVLSGGKWGPATVGKKLKPAQITKIETEITTIRSEITALENSIKTAEKAITKAKTTITKSERTIAALSFTSHEGVAVVITDAKAITREIKGWTKELDKMLIEAIEWAVKKVTR